MNFDDVTDPFTSVDNGCDNNIQNRSNCFGNICNIFKSCNLKSILPILFLVIILLVCFSKK